MLIFINPSSDGSFERIHDADHRVLMTTGVENQEESAVFPRPNGGDWVLRGADGENLAMPMRCRYNGSRLK